MLIMVSFYSIGIGFGDTMGLFVITGPFRTDIVRFVISTVEDCFGLYPTLPLC